MARGITGGPVGTRHYIVKIESLQGQDVTREQHINWFGQHDNWSEAVALWVVIAVDEKGAAVVDDGYRNAAEAKQAWPEAITDGE